MIKYKVTIDDFGFTNWYNLEDKRHRLDGPAVEGFEYQCWYENGRRHRKNGPALIDKYHVEFWLDGEFQFSLSVENYNKLKQYFITAEHVEFDGKKYKLVEDK